MSDSTARDAPRTILPKSVREGLWIEASNMVVSAGYRRARTLSPAKAFGREPRGSGCQL